MRSPSAKNKAEGKNDFDKYVDDSIKSCTLEGLARALHAEQDCAAAGHKDFPVWDGGAHGIHWPGWQHFWDDVNASDQEWEDGVKKTKETIERFKKACRSCAQQLGL